MSDAHFWYCPKCGAQMYGFKHCQYCGTSENADLIGGLRRVRNLHEFAELFGFDWEDGSDWTWHDVAAKMADTIEALMVYKEADK